ILSVPIPALSSRIYKIDLQDAGASCLVLSLKKVACYAAYVIGDLERQWRDNLSRNGTSARNPAGIKARWNLSRASAIDYEKE
ncbi:hypothetical protein KKB28_01460, partial [bacterium]|nr:hypothetical protein [bacterium]